MVRDYSIRALKTVADFASNEDQPDEPLTQAATSIQAHKYLKMQSTNAE
jgi:hypothetical protein